MDVVAIAVVATGAAAVARAVAPGFQLLRRRLKARAALEREVAYLATEIIRLEGVSAYRQADLESEVVYLANEIIRLEGKLADLQAELWKRTRRRRA